MKRGNSDSMVITVPDLAPGQFDIDGSDCKYCYMLTLETVGFLELIFQTEWLFFFFNLDVVVFPSLEFEQLFYSVFWMPSTCDFDRRCLTWNRKCFSVMLIPC